HEPQVFRLSVLPGTEFRRRSEELGLEFQPRPPYHVLSTPSLRAEEIQQLMAEAEQAFHTDFDPLPIANDELSAERVNQGGSVWRIDLDEASPAPSPETVDIAHTLWITAREFADRSAEIVPWVRRVVGENPHTSLWVVLDVTQSNSLPTAEDVFHIMDALYEQPPTYWDWHLALHPKPGRLGAKRIVIYSERPLKGRLA
ncbi:MAG: hypothetical protein H5U01_14470, partial [Clostridia bacterium]|nr:hypothetical protein [Clostridia bacterium]